MDHRELLASVSIFSSLSDSELDLLLAATTTKRLDQKEILFPKGDPGNQLYGILSGSLKVMVTGSDGKDVIFTLLGPGDTIGEIALLDGEERSATAVAVEPTDLLTLHRR
jgi:CRP-like cAMP-binding protein